jgi:hypothetical protein
MLIFGFIVIVGILFILVFLIAGFCLVIGDKPKTISTEEQVGLSKVRSYPPPKVLPYSPIPYRISDIARDSPRNTRKVFMYKRTVSTTEIFIEIEE